MWKINFTKTKSVENIGTMNLGFVAMLIDKE